MLQYLQYILKVHYSSVINDDCHAMKGFAYNENTAFFSPSSHCNPSSHFFSPSSATPAADVPSHSSWASHSARSICSPMSKCSHRLLLIMARSFFGNTSCFSTAFRVQFVHVINHPLSVSSICAIPAQPRYLTNPVTLTRFAPNLLENHHQKLRDLEMYSRRRTDSSEAP